MWHSMTSTTLTCLLVVVVSCCLLCDHVTGLPTYPEKRAIRRYPRARYRVGYMFGKRASSSSTSRFGVFSRINLTNKAMESLLKNDEGIRKTVVRLLDRNSDGNISLADFMDFDWTKNQEG